jgi:hypothetical protein
MTEINNLTAIFNSIVNSQNILFNLGMFTYPLKVIWYKSHSKDYREGDSAVKKSLSDLALPLHVVKELLEKCAYVITSIYLK